MENKVNPIADSEKTWKEALIIKLVNSTWPLGSGRVNCMSEHTKYQTAYDLLTGQTKQHGSVFSQQALPDHLYSHWN